MRRLRLPLFVSAPSLCRSVRDTSAPRLFSPPTDRGGVGLGSGPWFTGWSTSRSFPRRQEALPASRETLYCSALLSDPGRTSASDRNDASVLPTLFLRRRLHRYNPFRGSITRLCSSLPTLEGAISDASQGSLPAAGQALPGGLVPAGFQLRLSFAHSLSLSFRCWLERHPASSDFCWRQGNWILYWRLGSERKFLGLMKFLHQTPTSQQNVDEHRFLWGGQGDAGGEEECGAADKKSVKSCQSIGPSR